MDANALMRLIDLVYAAAQDDRGWEPFLSLLADSVGGQGAVLVSHTLDRAGAVAVSGRLDPRIMDAYNRYFHVHDSFALSLRAKPVNQRSGVFIGETLVARSDMLRTEFGNDFAMALDITRMMTAIVQNDDPSAPVTGVTVLRRDRDWSFDESDRLFFQRVFPHINRALGVRRRLRGAEQTDSALGSTFDLLPAPAILVDRHARILRANRRAEKLLGCAKGLRVLDGVLAAEVSDDTSRLHAACAAAASPSVDHMPGETLRVRRLRSVEPLRVIISPLPQVGDTLSLEGDRAIALILIEEPQLGPRPDVRLLQRLYGLTFAEAEIAARIAVGDALDEIAEMRQCSLQTVQWHNKRILSKMGCGSRRELVRQLTLSVASVAARD